jgi:hypothetical protein
VAVIGVRGLRGKAGNASGPGQDREEIGILNWMYIRHFFAFL